MMVGAVGVKGRGPLRLHGSGTQRAQRSTAFLCPVPASSIFNWRQCVTFYSKQTHLKLNFPVVLDFFHMPQPILQVNITSPTFNGIKTFISHQ